MCSGEETGRPEPVGKCLHVGAVGHLRSHHDEGRKFFVGGAEAVGKPRADRRAAGKHVAGGELEDGGLVIDRIGVERLDQTDVVHEFGSVRQEIGDPRAGFSVLAEFGKARRDRETGLAGGHAGERLATAHRLGQVAVEETGQGGLVVPRLELGGAPAMKR